MRPISRFSSGRSSRGRHGNPLPVSRSYLLLVAPLLLLCAQAPAAGLLDGSWYVSGAVSYIDDDEDRDVDDGLSGYQLGLGKDLSEASSIELTAIGTHFKTDGFDQDQRQYGLGIDFFGKFGSKEYFVPYVVLGYGAIKTESRDSGAMTSLGIGVLTPLKWFGLKLRTELRMRNDNSVGTRRDYLLTFGLQRSIRMKPVVFRDSDGDGVVDPDDRCGNTARGATVDRYGCAQTLDTDGDGVPDDRDMCGDSPPGSKVDEYGCKRSDRTEPRSPI